MTYTVRLMRDDELAARMGQAAREKATAFTEKSFTDRSGSIVNELG
jgi:hypothetical protein